MDLGQEIAEEEYAEILEALNFPPGSFLPLLWELRQKIAVIETYYVEDE